jgi:hypothetical protein
MSVVDGHLKVHGIDNLRVADASIMPRITSANTMASCVVIGERAAQFIKADHHSYWCRGSSPRASGHRRRGDLCRLQGSGELRSFLIAQRHQRAAGDGAVELAE